MKFTEGYWCMREDINHLYALSAYEVQPIPGGMRVIAPCKPMRSRGDVPNMPVLTIEFTSPAKNVVGVKAYHHLGYEKKDPRFEKHFDVQVKEEKWKHLGFDSMRNYISFQYFFFHFFSSF